MQSVEAEGDSIDAAIDSALQQLGVARDRVEIDILTNAARGVLGFGSRKARVRATLRPEIEASPALPAATAEVAIAATPSKEPEPPQEPPVEGVSDADRQTAERASAMLQEVVRLVGVDAGVEIRHDDGHIILDLTRDDTGVLIGRRGQMLDALEYVLNRIVLKDQGEAARIVVDSQGYRQRRRESLEEMALRMADQAKARHKPVTLNPMSPRDRRIVHLALQNDPALTTKSSGDGYYRKLVILPKGSGSQRRGRPAH